MQKYKATGKRDVTKGVTKYMATPVFGDKAGNLELAKELSKGTSLNITDVLSVIEQLPEVISNHLSDGDYVHVKGVGMFSASIVSDLMDTPEDVTPEKVRFSKIAFKADASLRIKVAGALRAKRVE